MSKHEYHIGQILFILSQKYNKVIPVKITEHIISKTADGEKSKYIVSPYFNKNKSYNLEQLAGTVLFSTKEVYDHMLGNAAAAIETIIGESVENAKLLGYEHNTEQLLEHVVEDSPEDTAEQQNIEDNILTETANTEQQTEQTYVTDVPDTITLPDGTVAKVNIK